MQDLKDNPYSHSTKVDNDTIDLEIVRNVHHYSNILDHIPSTFKYIGPRKGILQVLFTKLDLIVDLIDIGTKKYLESKFPNLYVEVFDSWPSNEMYLSYIKDLPVDDNEKLVIFKRHFYVVATLDEFNKYFVPVKIKKSYKNSSVSNVSQNISHHSNILDYIPNTFKYIGPKKEFIQFFFNQKNTIVDLIDIGTKKYLESAFPNLYVSVFDDLLSGIFSIDYIKDLSIDDNEKLALILRQRYIVIPINEFNKYFVPVKIKKSYKYSNILEHQLGLETNKYQIKSEYITHFKNTLIRFSIPAKQHFYIQFIGNKNSINNIIHRLNLLKFIDIHNLIDYSGNVLLNLNKYDDTDVIVVLSCRNRDFHIIASVEDFYRYFTIADTIQLTNKIFDNTIYKFEYCKVIDKGTKRELSERHHGIKVLPISYILKDTQLLHEIEYAPYPDEEQQLILLLIYRQIEGTFSHYLIATEEEFNNYIINNNTSQSSVSNVSQNISHHSNILDYIPNSFKYIGPKNGAMQLLFKEDNTIVDLLDIGTKKYLESKFPNLYISILDDWSSGEMYFNYIKDLPIDNNEKLVIFKHHFKHYFFIVATLNDFNKYFVPVKRRKYYKNSSVSNVDIKKSNIEIEQDISHHSNILDNIPNSFKYIGPKKGIIQFFFNQKNIIIYFSNIEDIGTKKYLESKFPNLYVYFFDDLLSNKFSLNYIKDLPIDDNENLVLIFYRQKSVVLSIDEFNKYFVPVKRRKSYRYSNILNYLLTKYYKYVGPKTDYLNNRTKIILHNFINSKKDLKFILPTWFPVYYLKDIIENNKLQAYHNIDLLPFNENEKIVLLIFKRYFFIVATLDEFNKYFVPVKIKKSYKNSSVSNYSNILDHIPSTFKYIGPKKGAIQLFFIQDNTIVDLLDIGTKKYLESAFPDLYVHVFDNLLSGILVVDYIKDLSIDDNEKLALIFYRQKYIVIPIDEFKKYFVPVVNKKSSSIVNYLDFNYSEFVPKYNVFKKFIKTNKQLTFVTVSVGKKDNIIDELLKTNPQSMTVYYYEGGNTFNLYRISDIKNCFPDNEIFVIGLYGIKPTIQYYLMLSLNDFYKNFIPLKKQEKQSSYPTGDLWISPNGDAYSVTQSHFITAQEIIKNNKALQEYLEKYYHRIDPVSFLLKIGWIRVAKLNYQMINIEIHNLRKAKDSLIMYLSFLPKNVSIYMEVSGDARAFIDANEAIEHIDDFRTYSSIKESNILEQFNNIYVPKTPEFKKLLGRNSDFEVIKVSSLKNIINDEIHNYYISDGIYYVNKNNTLLYIDFSKKYLFEDEEAIVVFGRYRRNKKLNYMIIALDKFIENFDNYNKFTKHTSKTSNIRKSVEEIAEEVQNDIIRANDYYADFTAMCLECSRKLALALKQEGYKNVYLVIGKFIIDKPDYSKYETWNSEDFNSDEEMESEMYTPLHYWVEVDGNIVDITANQFNSELEGEHYPPIVYGTYEQYPRYIKIHVQKISAAQQQHISWLYPENEFIYNKKKYSNILNHFTKEHFLQNEFWKLVLPFTDKNVELEFRGLNVLPYSKAIKIYKLNKTNFITTYNNIDEIIKDIQEKDKNVVILYLGSLLSWTSLDYFLQHAVVDKRFNKQSSIVDYFNKDLLINTKYWYLRFDTKHGSFNVDVTIDDIMKYQDAKNKNYNLDILNLHCDEFDKKEKFNSIRKNNEYIVIYYICDDRYYSWSSLDYFLNHLFKPFTKNGSNIIDLFNKTLIKNSDRWFFYFKDIGDYIYVHIINALPYKQAVKKYALNSKYKFIGDRLITNDDYIVLFCKYNFKKQKASLDYYYTNIDYFLENSKNNKIVNSSIKTFSSFYGWMSPEGEYYAINDILMTHAQLAVDILKNKLKYKEKISELYKANYILLNMGWLRIDGENIEIGNYKKAKDSLIEYLSLLPPNKSVFIDIENKPLLFKSPNEALEYIENVRLSYVENFYGLISPSGELYQVGDNETHIQLANKIVLNNPRLKQFLSKTENVDEYDSESLKLLLRLGWIRVVGSTIEVVNYTKAKDALIYYLSLLSSNKIVSLDIDGEYRTFSNPRKVLDYLNIYY
jgi:hypothetical protein